MSYLILYGAVQAFFMTLLIVSKKQKSVADYILGSWLLLIGLHIFSYFVYLTHVHDQAKSLFDLNLAFPILNGPFLYIYVTSIIDKTNRFSYKSLLHFIPFVLVVSYLTHNVLYGDDNYTIRYYDSVILIRNISVLNITFNLLVLCIVPFYVIWCHFQLKKYQRNIKDTFSSIDKINLGWLHHLVYGLGVVWVVVFIMHLFMRDLNSSTTFLNNSIFSSYTIFVFFIGYFGFRQSNVFSKYAYGTNKYLISESNNSNEIEKIGKKYKQSGLKDDQIQKLHDQLVNFMNTEKPYLDNDLTLNKLSDLLGISNYYLSQILNEQQNQNFYDFINFYRVEEFKRRIADKKNNNFTLLSIAYECGFNSKSSFNRIFKNVTDKTPSEYKAAIE